MAAPSYVAQSAVVATTTAAPAGYPTTFASGDLLLLVIQSDSSSITLNTTGWTSLGATVTGGGMSSQAWYRVASGSETGTISATIAGGTKGNAWTTAYRAAAGGSLTAALYQSGVDTDTTSTAYSATGVSWTLATDDRLVAMSIFLAGGGGAFTAISTGLSLTSAGSTLTGSTGRFGGRAGTNTLYFAHHDAAVATGGTGAPNYSGTGVGANPSGHTLFIAIREGANTPPTVTATGGNRTVAATSTASLSFTAADSDGSVTGVNTTFDFPASGAPTLSGATTATPSFTTGSSPNLYVVRQTATDNGGATGFDTLEVRVPTTGNIKPLTGYTPVTTGTWTNTGGAANVGAALNDSSDATYVESAALSATSQEIRVRLDPATTRSTLAVTFRVAQDVVGTIVAKGRLYQGNTLLQEWTLTTTTTPSDQVCTLSAGTISAISDWGDLWAAVAGTA